MKAKSSSVLKDKGYKCIVQVLEVETYHQTVFEAKTKCIGVITLM